MNPALVAVPRNTNTATEDKTMTDEELMNTIKEVSGMITRLPHPNKSIDKDDDKQYRLLMLQKNTLERIKTARESGDKKAEMESIINYGLLTSQGEKNLLLLNFIKSNLGPEAFC
jgi:hypothetical protein